MITDFPLKFETFELGWRPNQCLALPPAFAAKASPHLISPVFDTDPDAIAKAWIAIITAAPRTRNLRQDQGQIEIVQTSKWMRFPDWVTAMPVALGPDRASICVYSRSKFGVRDFGVNPKRVSDWLDQLSHTLSRA